MSEYNSLKMIRNRILCKCRKEIILISVLSFLAGFWISLNWGLEVCVNNVVDKTLKYSNKVEDIDDTTEYVVIILSSPHNYHLRTVIRSTWMRLSQNINIVQDKKVYQWKHNNNNVNTFLKFYFIIGTRNLSNILIDKLKYESDLHKDLHILDKFEDGYKKLAEKMLLTMKWCSNSFSNLKYIIKTDDDSFVRIDKIVTELDLYGPVMNFPDSKKFITSKGINMASNGLIWGYFNGRASVYKRGQWEEKEWFLCDRYLPYPLGGGYVISKSIADYVERNNKILSQYNAEDVSMGVWTAPLDIHRVHDIRFNTEWISRSCSNSYLITHKHSVENMTEMYSNLLASNGNVLCNKVYGEKFSYLYNWNVLPDKSRVYT